MTTIHGPVIVRRYRRGGAMRWAGTTYFGWRPRPLREFWTLVRARRRGLAVPEPVATLVERRFGVLYRGALAMREISGALTVWEAARAGKVAATSLGRALRRFHDGGLEHRDLNLNNILVSGEGDMQRFDFIDLDRAVLWPGPLGGRPRARSLRRVRRSARRLDPTGQVIGEPFLRALEQGYGAGESSDA